MPKRVLQRVPTYAFPMVLLLASRLGAEPTRSMTGGEDPSSDSFVVQTYPGGPIASEVCAFAGKVRRETHRRWIANKPPEPWQPKCKIVLHQRRVDYLRSVGKAGAQTSGASLIKCVGGEIVERRVDLLVGERGQYPALPHELTHVVLADFFCGRQPPPWVDEGIATLADSQEKKALHRRDCRRALKNGNAMDLNALLELDRLTSRDQAAAFYGQSLSLVEYLADRGEPTQLLNFVDQARSRGYDQALRDIYDIEGIGELQRQWLLYETSYMTTARKQLATSR